MKKLNKKQISKRLNTFWDKYWKISQDFNEKVSKLEKDMNKKLNLGFNLEFFHVDGECVGIGAEDYSKRKEFPLIHDSEFI